MGVTSLSDIGKNASGKQENSRIRSLAVFEPPGGKLTQLISDRIQGLHRNGETGFAALVSGAPSVRRGLRPDLLVLPVGVDQLEPLPTGTSCGILLVPGSTADWAAVLSSTDIVSYGMSTQDNVSLSSIDESCVMLSLQRELTTLQGSVLERQEISVQRPRRMSPEDTMVSATALLMLGVPPEMLS